MTIDTETTADFPGFDVQPPIYEPDAEPEPQPSEPTTTPTPKTSRSPAFIGDGLRRLRSSPPLTGAKRGKAAEGLGELLELVVRRVGVGLHRRRTPDELVPNSIWLATADEAKAIAAPVGRILARTLPGVVAALFAAGEGAVGDATAALEATRDYARSNLTAEADFVALTAQFPPVGTDPQPATDL